MAEKGNVDYVCCEDLAADLEFKLADMYTFIKLISNSTCQVVDFEIDTSDMNKIALTLHDKIVAAMFVLQKLQHALEENS